MTTAAAADAGQPSQTPALWEGALEEARTPRARAEGGLKYEPRPTHRYSREELEAIGGAVHEEELRSAVPRHWEEVGDGDVLPPIIKGPLTATDMICWYSGAGHTYKAHGLAERHRGRHPADAFVNPAAGAATAELPSAHGAHRGA